MEKNIVNSCYARISYYESPSEMSYEDVYLISKSSSIEIQKYLNNGGFDPKTECGKEILKCKELDIPENKIIQKVIEVIGEKISFEISESVNLF